MRVELDLGLGLGEMRNTREAQMAMAEFLSVCRRQRKQLFKFAIIKFVSNSLGYYESALYLSNAHSWSAD